MSKFIKVTEDGNPVLINVEYIVMLSSDSKGKAVISTVPTIDRQQSCAITTEESFEGVCKLVLE